MNANNGELAIDAQNLTKSFGGVHAIRDVTYRVKSGTLTALIGPNGAGKSTLFNLLTNLYITDSGTVRFHGTDLTGMRSDRIARLGLIRTFQTARCFAGMSVLENVLAGSHIGSTARLWEQALWLPSVAHAERTVRDKADELLDLLGLARFRDEAAISLPLGLQKLLEIARALMARPKVLLLDEPAAGVPQQQSGEILSVISSLPDDIAVLFIEHDIDLVFRFAERITVLVAGRILCEGTPAEIAADPEVRRIYLGDEVHV
jgi:branched-chain amino acid transport system ATP-binding protein